MLPCSPPAAMGLFILVTSYEKQNNIKRQRKKISCFLLSVQKRMSINQSKKKRLFLIQNLKLKFQELVFPKSF